MMVDIPNYYERAVALLAGQFQGTLPNGTQTNFQKLLQAILSQAQVLNTQEQLLLNNRSLFTATGAQLDGIGQILGLARIPGQSDESYREDLEFQIFINSSSGTPEQVIAILKFLSDASKIWYNEVYPASYQMATNGFTFPPNPSDIVAAIQKASPAGVHFLAVTAIFETVPFAFATDEDAEQLYVSLDPNNPTMLNPFEANPGSGLEPFYVQRGESGPAVFGGFFAEAIGAFPNYTIDTEGAGQLAEAIQ